MPLDKGEPDSNKSA